MSELLFASAFMLPLILGVLAGIFVSECQKTKVLNDILAELRKQPTPTTPESESGEQREEKA